MRSILLVGARANALQTEAMESHADVVVATASSAITYASNWARKRARPRLYVRVIPWSTGDPNDDLASVVASRPDGVLVADARGAGDIVRLTASLAAQEAILGLDNGALGIVAMITSAAGALHAPSLRECGQRLQGLAWDADAVAASIGATAARDERGRLIGPCETARALCLLAASAAAVPAFDTPFDGNLESLKNENRVASRDGFRGKLTTHIEQIAIINADFATGS
ncbi:MAG: CoA ester lyase [Hyphomicrobiales bacterium]|nr:CoA ester lyase [Hyphomicrobiales bacterium]